MIQWLVAQPIFIQIITCVGAFNLALSGIAKGLEVVQDKTKTQIDNKTVVFINKITGLLQKGLDMVGFNPKH